MDMCKVRQLFQEHCLSAPHAVKVIDGNVH